MKFYTHPQLSSSSIQTKDGAFYTKRWLFFRQSLSLEIDVTSHRLWKKSQKKRIGVKKLEIFKRRRNFN